MNSSVPIRIILLSCLFGCLTPLPSQAQQAIPATTHVSYSWKPVHIGAGGFVTGFVSHPQNADIRYCRTDVGNAYRWDAGRNLWIPMKVSHPDGAGVPKATASAPSPGGVNSIAVDPSNTRTVSMAFATPHSADVGGGANVNVFTSRDGGIHFTAGDLNIAGDPNGSWRTYGERLMVDPNNGKVLYYGSDQNGLYRCTDAGATWSPVTKGNPPPPTSNVIGVQFYKQGGASMVDGMRVSSVIYALIGDGDVFRSANGGQTWTNITTDIGLSGHVAAGAIDQSTGALYVVQHNTRIIWKYASGAWTDMTNINTLQAANGIAIDPHNSNRLFVVGVDSSISRSTDGGAHWTSFGGLQFANRLGWLPQATTTNAWRSEAGLYFDKNGTLWLPQGNEGVLKYTPTGGNTEDSAKWTIESAGIEEFVTHDVIVPKGSGDTAIVAVEDATGLVVTNPDIFTARQIGLQTQLLSNCTGVAFCPNAGSYLVASTSDINYAGYPDPGRNFSGYSPDGGNTWTRFAAMPSYMENGQTKYVQTGSIAVSRRANWTLGGDHIVILPNSSLAPQYSKDGGKTWHQTTAFPLAADGRTLDGKKGFQGYWNLSLKQRMLYADPFVADKFYLKFTVQPDSLYVTTDGGVTWNALAVQGTPVTGLPNYAHHGQLAVNYNLQDDLWFAYGWEGGAGPGLYHRAPGAKAFVRINGVQSAITLALGKRRGQAGDAPYTAYFYGKRVDDPQWGVFRSTDAGASWERISAYPAGIYDQPTCMAASWDTFGLIYVGYGGNSFVYGKPM